MSKKMIHRLILNSIFFIVIMLFTFDIVFQGQSFREIVTTLLLHNEYASVCYNLFSAFPLSLFSVHMCNPAHRSYKMLTEKYD